MKILIAADSFKDSLDSIRVCKAIERGIKKASASIQTLCFPMADGGEGTSDILKYHLGGKKREMIVCDPLFRPIKTDYLISKDGNTAFIEMAKSSGLQLLSVDERNPLLTSTYGLGEMISDAINLGIKNIILAIGGSATNDAGIGMANALGYKFSDKNDQLLRGTGGDLIDIVKMEVSKGVKQKLSGVTFSVICDVRNILFGPTGAARVYGRQKGASDDDIRLLDAGLKNLAYVTHLPSLATKEGAGAAGGLGFGVMAFLDATLHRGVDLIIEITNFEQQVLLSDIIITGEGKIDQQTFHGKLIQGIIACAVKYDKPVYAFCGILDLAQDDAKKLGLKAAFSINKKSIDLSEALADTEKNLEATSYKMVPIISQ